MIIAAVAFGALIATATPRCLRFCDCGRVCVCSRQIKICKLLLIASLARHTL